MSTHDQLNNTALFDRYDNDDNVYTLDDDTDDTNFTFDFASYVGAVMFTNTYEENVDLLDYITDAIWSRDVMHEIIAMDDIAIVMLSMQRGVEFSIDDIVFAVECNADLVACGLLDAIEISAQQYSFVLRTASICGRIAVVRKTLRKFPHLTTNEALLVATDHENIDVVEFLLQFTNQAADNYLALSHACNRRNVSFVKMLIRNDIPLVTVGELIKEIFKNPAVVRSTRSIIEIVLSRYPIMATHMLIGAVAIFDIPSVQICMRYNADILGHDRAIYHYVDTMHNGRIYERDQIYRLMKHIQLTQITDIAIGLAAMDLPVLVMLTIVEQVFETKYDGTIVYMNPVDLWALLRRIKHA